MNKFENFHYYIDKYAAIPSVIAMIALIIPVVLYLGFDIEYMPIIYTAFIIAFVALLWMLLIPVSFLISYICYRIRREECKKCSKTRNEE